MESQTTRRNALRLLTGVPLLAGLSLAATDRALSATARLALIERLIRDSRDLPHVSQRIDAISRGLLGVRYQANTLIGGSRQPERFVVRDDAFDCVTFCEVVLAAAISRDTDGFEDALRRIRYDHGDVRYDRRNHYFADWCRRNVENRICQPVPIASMTIDKAVTWHREFGVRHVSIAAVARSTFLGNARLLAPGDIIGFASQRPGLDFYHTGLVAFGPGGELRLRHASRSRGRVVEERMARFVAVNRVRYVALLRAAETTSAEMTPPAKWL
jgi:hypothetical protein